MKRFALILAVAALFSACGPDNPYAPNPSVSALTGKIENGTNAVLTWNRCGDLDFSSYTIYRASTSGIKSNAASAKVLKTIDKSTTVEYKDENLESGIWYYALKTSNDSGGISWSNEVSVKIL